MDKLRPVLEFSKAHRFELSCAGAAILVFGALWWYLPGVSEGVRQAAEARLVLKKSVIGFADTPTNIDGLTYTGNIKDLTPTETLIKFKERANAQMTRAKNELVQLAQDKNRKDRVTPYNKGLAPLFTTTAKPEILEVVDGLPNGRLYMGVGAQAALDTNPFLDKHYKFVFDQMAMKLTGSSSNPQAGVVPAYTVLDKNYKEARDKKFAAIPEVLRPKETDIAAANLRDAKDRDDYIRNALMGIATSSMIYVDPEYSIQHRPMLQSGGGRQMVAPTPSEVFEAYVDNWIQWDVVNAIYETNKYYGATPTVGVAKSAVKRLISLIDGPGAMLPFGANAADSPALAIPSAGLFLRPIIPLKDGKPTNGSNGLPDMGFSITGRVEDIEYHMVPVAISIVCEPTAVSKFIENLYRTNNGYTVLARKDSIVDPYTSAAAGYLYGDKQVIQVDLLLECAMFRSWLDQVMPANYSAGGGAGVP